MATLAIALKGPIFKGEGGCRKITLHIQGALWVENSISSVVSEI